MNPGTIRKKVLVTGDVQGVFFRDSCGREAQRRDVSGHAANLPGGRVEVVLEGAPEGVDAMVEWCREGSSQARVDSIDVSSEEPQGLSGFRTA